MTSLASSSNSAVQSSQGSAGISPADLCIPECLDRVARPWGWFAVVFSDKTIKTKIMVVHPGARMSLQSHCCRDEHWTVLRGSGTFVTGTVLREVGVGDTGFIPSGTIHRIENLSSDCDLVVLEVQSGTPDEDDIVRIEDDYDRACSSVA